MSTPKLWKRDVPKRTAPVRRAGGFYRTAEGKQREFGGVPLNTANDALVAAVRLAYKVAEAQVGRSTRLARRLREAGDRQAGPGSGRKALDASERLVMNTLLSGLEWWEASVADGRCPVKRLAVAEYQMLGSILGLAPAKGGSRAARGERAERGEASGKAPGAPPAPRRRLRILHAGKPRAVRVAEWDFEGAAASLEERVEFVREGGEDREPLLGRFTMKGKEPILELDIPAGAPGGLWKAAICSREREQVGYIEIRL